jgi:3-hydroxy-9,10-secoandrosta-1,3,5(10)-triene-9,17-dione monooxygenase
MTKRVIDRVMDIADQLREQAVEAERIGRLTDQTTKAMKEVGSIRLLQTAKYGGYEVHPREFAETVMATAALDPAAGWITGVVAVHPYQLAYADPRVAEEIWADDFDTWVASPYAPQGVAKPVDGGYLFSGHWQFSSGTDQCDWIILGAMLGDADGTPVMPPQMLHMILPRKDYQIVEDSWNVVGLRGTGSKDIIVRDAFVPDYRTMDAAEVMDGTAQRKAGMTKPLYLMPWSTMFPLGITAAVVGIAEGALAAHLDYQRDRVGATGTAIKDDPYVMYAIGEAAADINAARQELLANVDRIYDIVEAGKDVSFQDRAAGRRTQFRAAWRAVMAVDQIFSRSGGSALRMDKPLQRYWRDAHAGLAHHPAPRQGSHNGERSHARPHRRQDASHALRRQGALSEGRVARAGQGLKQAQCNQPGRRRVKAVGQCIAQIAHSREGSPRSHQPPQ